MTPDVIYDQLIGMGCAREARLLVGREPRRRLAAPAPRRGRARLAAAARARGALARRAWRRRTRPARRTCPFGVLRGYAGGDLAGADARRARSRARSPARSSPRCRAHRPDVGIVHAQQADRRGQRPALGDHRRAEGGRARLGAVDRHRRGGRRRARAAAGRRRAAGLGDRRGLRRARRRASLLRARLLRPRQRLLRRAGTRSAATATRSAPGWSEHVLGTADVEDYHESLAA